MAKYSVAKQNRFDRIQIITKYQLVRVIFGFVVFFFYLEPTRWHYKYRFH